MAGKNAASATLMGAKVSFEAFQNLAGALHEGGKTGLMQTILTGKSWGSAPTYGENNYQYRMSRSGWQSTGRKL